MRHHNVMEILLPIAFALSGLTHLVFPRTWRDIYAQTANMAAIRRFFATCDLWVVRGIGVALLMIATIVGASSWL